MPEANSVSIRLDDDLGYLHVSGGDATRFLHNQFTNNIEALPAPGWLYAGYCTPKGRLLAFMTVLRRATNDYLLLMPRDVLAAVQQRLRMYVLRDDVHIEADDEGLAIVGLLGEPGGSPGSLLAGLESSTAACDENGCLLRLDEAGRRLLLLAPEPAVGSAGEDMDRWALAEIEAGIPRVEKATMEAWVPQMVNLDLIGGVSFKKGCYPGQEVVARVHYLGRIKQRMYRLTTASAAATSPAGTPVYAAGLADGPAGTVVRAAARDGGQDLLAVLQCAVVDEGQALSLATADGPALLVESLPYPFPDAGS